MQEKVTDFQVYKSELPDIIIRLFSSSNCCYDLRNSIKFEVPHFNLEVRGTQRELLRRRPKTSSKV